MKKKDNKHLKERKMLIKTENHHTTKIMNVFLGQLKPLIAGSLRIATNGRQLDVVGKLETKIST